MTDEEALQIAVAQAEAEVAALERELESVTSQRKARSQQTLAALNTRKTELAEALRALSTEQREIEAQQHRLRAELQRPRLWWTSLVASPVTWFLRSVAFTIYVSSVIAAHRFLQSPGLVFALVLGLPVAFVLVMVAGSLRESGVAHQVGARTGPGEDAARQPAIDERAGTATGGAGDHREVERGDRGARTQAGEDR